jgi:hypothetical protein
MKVNFKVQPCFQIKVHSLVRSTQISKFLNLEGFEYHLDFEKNIFGCLDFYGKNPKSPQDQNGVLTSTFIYCDLARHCLKPPIFNRNPCLWS